MKYAFILSLLAAPVFADCSDGTDYSDEIAQIVADMQAAPDPGTAPGCSARVGGVLGTFVWHGARGGGFLGIALRIRPVICGSGPVMVAVSDLMLQCVSHAPPIEALPRPPSPHRLSHPRWRSVHLQRRRAHPRWRDAPDTGLHDEQQLGRSPAGYCIFLVLEVRHGVLFKVQKDAIVL